MQHLVADEVQSNSRRSGLVEEKRGDSLQDVSPQSIPRIGLREDVLGQTFGTVATTAVVGAAPNSGYTGGS